MPTALLSIPARPRDANDTWTLLKNREPAHTIDPRQLEDALDLVERGLWHHHPAQAVKLGRLLYHILNGTHLLDDLQRQVHQRGQHQHLALDVPANLRDLPWELIHDGDGFALHRGGLHLVRQVTDRNAYRKREPASRNVQMLFMACAPLDSQPSLNFEKEEELIFRQLETHKLPVDVYVEDSGSLEGLRFMLQERQNVDVIHLSGHAKATDDGPVFMMESETGTTHAVSPGELWQALEDHPPQLLFLSGCETGRTAAVKTDAATSFARSMVEAGVPMVLGWGLSVLDTGATAFAQHLYTELGKGHDLALAVFKARKKLLQDHHTWPLIRVFCDASPMQTLANPKKKVVHHHARSRTYHTLAGSQVKVMPYGFVGRRRQVQRGMRVLKGEHANKRGLLLTGVAGVGKSTLTGKLVERYAPDHLIVFHGELNHGTFLAELRAHFDKLGDQKALEILATRAELKDRIKALMRDCFNDGKVLMIFDDYEQNLVDESRLHNSQQEIMPPLLQGLSWNPDGVRVIITSRHPFKVEEAGQDRVEVLERIALMSMRNADFDKLQQSLVELEKRPHQKALFKKLSGGNPRLMEWFDIALRQNPALDAEALSQTLVKENETYRQEYLAQLIARAETEDFQTFLSKAAIYWIPVAAEAYEKFGTPAMLQRAVDLTLMEQEGKDNPRYWVMPLLRVAFYAQAKEQKELHKIAYAWHDQQARGSDWDIQDSVECIYHGSAAYAMKSCWHHAARLASYYIDTDLYREDLTYLKTLWQFVDVDAFAEALAGEDHGPVLFLNAMGNLLQRMGAFVEAFPYFDQALTIRKRVLGDDHAATASSLNNLGMLLKAMGDLAAAKPYLEEALAIRERVLGDDHADTATSLNNLGFLLQTMGELAAAKPYFEDALAIWKRVLGGDHVGTISSLNNLGSLLQTMGELAAAKPYLEEALAISKRILRDGHADTAKSLNNLGSLLQAMGELAAAKPYLEEALAIRMRVLGDEHDATALSLSNLGMLLEAMGELAAAKPYLEDALAIRMRVLGGEHADTALSLSNLGLLIQAMGDFVAAKPYLEEALAISKRVLGDGHGETVNNTWNLLCSEWSMGEKEAARQWAVSLLWLFNAEDGQLSAYHKTVRDRLVQALPYMFGENLEGLKKYLPNPEDGEV